MKYIVVNTETKARRVIDAGSKKSALMKAVSSSKFNSNHTLSITIQNDRAIDEYRG